MTCHDGFTLHDLVSYEEKHNAANGEGNRDGSDYNLSRNWGVEGPATTTQVARVRERVKRSLLATLAFSQGVPLLSHGDELGRTQHGNNNAYCHDGPVTWVHWTLDADQRAMLAFVRRILALRAATPALRRRTFFPTDDGRRRRIDLAPRRRHPDGRRRLGPRWNHVLGMQFEGSDPILLLMNGGGRSRAFVLPERPKGWWVLLDTAHEGERPVESGLTLAPHSLVLLRQR